jgi:integrase
MGGVYQPTYLNPKTGLRKTSAVWWVIYRHRRRLYRKSSHSTKRTEAVDLLKRCLTEIGKGRLIGPDAEKTTFDDLSQILRNDYEANERSLDRVKSALSHLKEHFKEALALDITNDPVTAYIARRRDEGAQNATINRELSALKRALRLAHEANKLAVVPHIKLLEENNTRKGFFEREQLEAVLSALPTRRLRPRDVTANDLTAALRVAYITGWRLRSEILSRQKHHVDLEWPGWLRLEPGETKNREGRMFPLTSELRAVLEEQLQRTREFEKATGQIVPWLFHRNGKPLGAFRKTWKRACQAAGVPDRIPHDFRRTAVRNLERAGVPRSAAMAMVGHKTEAIYWRYAIADEAMLRESATKLSVFHQAEQRPENALDDRKVVPFPKAER